jgi:RimJ/RimL family protein N-acetyltransferase
MDIEVSLRDVQEGDLSIFYEQQLDPEATQMAAFPASDYEAFKVHWAKGMGESTTILQTIIFQGKVAGNIVSWEQSGECNVGYRLGKEYWGKGIASAALSLFLKQVAKRPLFAHVTKHNAASIRVLQKCGFATSSEGQFSGVDSEAGKEFIMMLA